MSFPPSLHAAVKLNCDERRAITDNRNHQICVLSDFFGVKLKNCFTIEQL